MELQLVAPYLIALIPFVATDSVVNEGLRLKHISFKGCRRCESLPQIMDNPVEYIRTPHFDVMLLREESSSPIWERFAHLFQPIDLRNAQRIEVSYGNNILKKTNGFRPLSINLNRLEVESFLAMLGHKKHIILLCPRNCRPHYARRVIEKRLMTEFKNEFLRKLLQKVHETKHTRQAESELIDPIISRILQVLDEDDRKMINDVKESFEGKAVSSSPPEKRRVDYIFKNPKGVVSTDNQYEGTCNENYVFLLQNQENTANPRSLNDLLLRVLRVVTTDSP